MFKTSDETGLLKFTAEIAIIGINPFVFIPDNILTAIYEQAGRDKGAIPVKGVIGGKPYQQTLVKYRNFWRLYINTSMLKNSPKRLGETIEISIGFDSSDRTIAPHPKLLQALNKNPEAKAVFDKISPSLRKEIVRYISLLKTEESVDRNVVKAVDFLLGRGRFVGRNNP